MSKPKPLGRGLSALIQQKPASPGTEAATAPGERIYELPLDELRPNRGQPRREIDPAELAELAESIRENGVLQPILVYQEEGAYTIIAGERRFRACLKAGLKTVPALLRERPGERELLQMALIENIQREDLNPLDLASGYRTLVEDHHLTQEELARALGKSRASVANTLRLIKLPAVIKVSLKEGRITVGHAKALLGLAADDDKVTLWHRCLKRNLSVRQLEDLVQRHKEGPPPGRRQQIIKPFDILDAEDRIRQALGAQVQISPRREKGSISIAYTSKEELDRLLELLSGLGE